MAAAEQMMVDTSQIRVKDKKNGIETTFISPVLERMSRQQENPLLYAVERQKTSPEISEQSKATCAQAMVDYYKAIQTIDPALLLTDARYIRYKNFQSIVNELYKGKKQQELAAIAHDDKALSAFMGELMQDKKYAIWGLKIAEDQMAVLEATTSVHTKLNAEADKRKHRTIQRSLNPYNDTPVDQARNPLGKDDLSKKRQGWNRLALWARPTFDRASPLARKLDKKYAKALRAEGRKNSQIIVETDLNENARLDMNVKIQGRELDDVQKAYIRNMQYLGRVAEGDFININAEEEVVRKKQEINAAQININAHLGFDCNTAAQLNILHRTRLLPPPPVGSPREWVYNSTPDAPNIVLDNLGFKKVAGQSLEISVGAGSSRNYLDRQIARLQFGIQENLKEISEKKRPLKALPIIEGTIQQLQGAENAPRNPDRVAEIDTQLPKYTELQAHFDTVAAAENEISSIQSQQRVVEARLQAESGITDPGTGTILKNEELLGKWDTAQQEVTQAEDTLRVKQAERDAIPTKIESLQGQVELKNRRRSEVLQEIRIIEQAIEVRRQNIQPTQAEQQELDLFKLELDGDPKRNILGLKHQIVDLKAKNAPQVDQDLKNQRMNEVLQEIRTIDQTIEARRQNARPTQAEQDELNLLKLELDGDPTQNITGLKQDIVDLKAQILTARQEIPAKDAEIATAQNEVNQKQTNFDSVKTLITQETYDDIKNLKQTQAELRNQIRVKQSEISDKEIEMGMKLHKDPNDPTSPTWTREEVKETIARMNAEKAAASQPERSITRKLTAYRELQGRLQEQALLATYDRARQTIDVPEVNDALRDAMDAYPEYPPAYLYALQVAYGRDIINPQKQDAFKKATTLITPAIFIAQLRQRGQPVTDIYDSVLGGRNLVAVVDGNFMKHMYDRLITDAKDGSLGELSPNAIASLKQIENTPATDYAEFKKDRVEATENTIDIIRQNVPREEAKYYLRSAGINQNLDDYIDSFESVYNGNPPDPDAPASTATQQEMAVYLQHKNSLSVDEAQAAAQKLYALYNKGAVANNLYSHMLESGFDANKALECSAAVLLINDTADQEQFMAKIEEGKSMKDMMRAFMQMPQAQRPSYYPVLREYVLNVHALGPNPRRDQLKTVIDRVFSNQKVSTVPASSLSDPRVVESLVGQSKILDTLHDEHAIDRLVSQMDMTVYHFEDVSDLTYQLIKLRNLSVNNVDTVKHYKMVAERIIKKRNKLAQ